MYSLQASAARRFMLFSLVFIFSLVSAADLAIETSVAVSCSRPTKSGDKISVHYVGKLESTGIEFDQSYKRGKPFTFTLGVGAVIAGWDKGLEDMCPGEERRLTIPPELGYGEFGSPPVIPGGATLVFDTKLVDIVGVKQETLSFASSAEPTTSTEPTLGIATAPPQPTKATGEGDQEDGNKEHEEVQDNEDNGEKEEATTTTEVAPSSSTSPSDPKTAQDEAKHVECHLLGPFALLVQGALGLVALLSLVYKRWRETPKRPWKIFFFDVSKQVFGSMLTHVLNLAMSMLGSVDMVNTAKNAAVGEAKKGDPRMPNPCSFYLLNLAIDTTLGIVILYLLLKVLHALFSFTPLAKPPQSIKSGNYGDPPRASWWAKQALIYFIGLTGMKMFVWFLFAAMPWLPWIGDWALRWTEGNEALQITFAMFVFPLAMNAVQYWVIDNFIMDKTRGDDNGGQGYERVHENDDDETRHDGTFVVGGEDDELPKDSDAPLTEVQPEPVSNPNGVNKGLAEGKGHHDD